MIPSPWHSRIQRLVEQDLERTILETEGPVGPEVQTPDGPKLLFCSNDYLGLAADPRIVDALRKGAERWGAGAGASRLVSGNTTAHTELERRLAAFVGARRAVAFASGYQANVGALTTLTAEGDAIFSDALTHASLIDGCRLSRAATHVYRHRDVEHLDQLLRDNPTPGIKLIVTDAVFSMDGDLAPLQEISQIASRHGAQIYLDEAHALGVLGPGGRGLAAELELTANVAIRMGTLGKAFGVSGAFVACDEPASRLLLSRARSLLYTTAAPPPLAEACLTALSLVEAADARRLALSGNVARFRELATDRGLPLKESTTAIQPVMVGDAGRTFAIATRLWQLGLFVTAFRPPTVAEDSSRLRVTLSAAHEPEQIELLVDGLAKAFSESGVPR
ncbi:MAG: 8-amino-7-oxononanoate synthase [Deltaproteobacteria bacterium]|nr:8-amino-7-oxononanoate synthase [Deltaproteobacteria bacterium]